MITKPQFNPCFRCGKQRKVVGVQKEKIGNSIVTTTQMICSDPKCQAILDKQLNKERERREEIKNMKQYRLSGKGKGI